MQMLKRLLQKLTLICLLLAGWLFASAMPRDWTIKGVVTDKNGNPVEAASVSVKGDTRGTKTDALGKFQLSVPENATLVITAVGYASTEIKITEEKEIKVSLEASASNLNEVVVVGYGTQKKGDLTAAISTVNAKNLEKQPTANLGTMLQGQAAGVIVSSGSGNPAGNPSIVIRGMNSINNDKPLYVVDGIPQDDSYDLNPNDIESVNILKDASASTIYGARAAGGVIIITTKKGKGGEPRVNFSGFFAQHKLNNNIDLLDKVSMNKVVRQAYANDNGTPPVYVMDDNKYGNTNWQDAFFKTGTEQKYDVDLSGSSDKISYRLSYGHWEHNGTVINSGAKRDNVRLNSDIKLLNNRLKISPILSYTKFNNKNFGDANTDGNAGYSEIMYLYEALPHIRIYDPASPNGYAKPEAELGSGNPVGERMLSDNRSNDDYLQINVSADLKLWKGLSYTLNVGKNFTNQYEYSQTQAYDFGAQAFNQFPSRSESRGRIEYSVFTHLLNYEKSFGDHTLKAMYGFSREKKVSTGTSGAGNHLSSPLIEALSGLIIEGSGDYIRANGWNFSNTLQSFFGRLNYSYNDKYLLQGSIRRDGSSRFAPEHRYGTFWSASAGWNMHKENWFRVSWIDELKPRVSYGIVGNQNISNFQYLARIYLLGSSNVLNYPFGPKASQQVYIGAISNAFANNNIKWEQTGTFNAGLNFSLLKNRLSGSFDYFKSRTEDMLAETPIPSSSGITQFPLTNIATMENKGWELSLTYRQSNASGFSFDVTGNVSHSQNKIIRLGYDEGVIQDGSVDYTNRTTTITKKGIPLGSFYLYQTAGIFQKQEEIAAYKNKDGELLQPNAKPGDLKFVDVNDDGTLDDGDKVLMGSSLPDLDFGINFNASYKNWDLSMFFNGKKGLKMYNGAKMFLYRFFRSADLSNAWTPDNPNTDVFRVSNSDVNLNQRVSNYFLEDASFVRLRNIQIGYTVPSDLLKRAYLSKLRIYVGAYNLFTITNYTGFDPDLTSTGIFSRGVDRGYYPLSRSFVAGINLGF
ncbi:SusC/RagA family TonB-linked outer membrane protein [Pseudobacter ginsenosidimutans]|uniref:TonB-linked SusC/RagA family outer membrane protein n=1 Tax=Pseudobacter ginsenosidimutans TaxID=661488 RepID=A0A4Q7MGK4_9BACT|nr:TonB-dependent receptor [Pseudobacter ginsenosidimutans]QEC45278.1 TonB-dependent receptor [Pseudobacter ginsenosidimutans]RZS65549.1 TonB-linked SusC/RagA family outer membrane protein [Pseudobacter ginsenosidimutans]